jgi:transposase InsO family protein
VDNGAPWGSTGGLPTDLALWVLGLGVDVWWNRARRPQDNAVVERGHGTTGRWADPGRCRGLEEFRARVAEEDRLLRETGRWFRRG